jgi:hypothetical protein
MRWNRERAAGVISKERRKRGEARRKRRKEKVKQRRY